MKKNKRHLYKRLPKYALGTMKPMDLGYQRGMIGSGAKSQTEQNISLEPETQTIRKGALSNALGYVAQQTPYITESLKLQNQAQQAAVPQNRSFQQFSNNIADRAKNTFNQSVTNIGSSVYNTTGSATTNAWQGVPYQLPQQTQSYLYTGWGNALGGAGSSALSNTGSFSAGIKNIASGAKSAMKAAVQDVSGQLAKESAKRAGTSTLGTAMSAVGTALGAYTMANQIAGFGDHRSPSDMMANVGRAQNTTEYGNQYTTYNGVNTAQELAYEKANARSKQLGFGMNAIGTGASIGSFFGPIGTGIGAAAGLLLGGLGSLFGWGDNSEEIERITRLTNDNIAMYNRQGESVARSKDVAAEFNDRQGVAAAEEGKSVYGPMKILSKYIPGKNNFNVNPDGTISYGPTGSKIEGQEVTGNPNGDAAIAPGNPKEGDVVNSSITPYDDNFVISNRNPYIKNARNIVKDQNRLDYIIANAGGSKEQQQLQIKEAEKMKKINTNKLMEIVKYNPAAVNPNAYKNGKLPGFDVGKRSYMMPGISDYLMNLVPHLYEFGVAKYMQDRYKNASTYVPDTYVQNNGSANAINRMLSVKWDPTQALNDARKAYNQANWQANRMAGLGAGGQAVLRNTNFLGYLDKIGDIRSKEQEINNNYTLAGLNKAIEYYDKQQQLLTDEGIRRFGWQQQQNAAKEYGIDLKGKDKASAVGGAGHDLYGVMQMARSMGISNQMLDLYDRQVANDEYKVYMDYLNRQNNKPTANYTYPSLLQQAAYTTAGRTPQEAIFSSIPRLNPRSIKIKGFEDGKGAFVDTRSDTTYKGRHEGRIPVGAGYGAAAQGPLALLSMFDIPSVVNNPYVQIGIAPTPGKSTKGLLKRNKRLDEKAATKDWLKRQYKAEKEYEKKFGIRRADDNAVQKADEEYLDDLYNEQMYYNGPGGELWEAKYGGTDYGEWVRQNWGKPKGQWSPF